MKPILTALLGAICALATVPAYAQAPEITLTRLECGTPQAPIDVNPRFSDTTAYNGLKLQFVYSCYLIKHGSDYMLWDAGQSMSAGAVAPKVSLVDLLAQVSVTPDQVKMVGISHYHGDHIGQADSFPKAKLMIGKGDWDGLNSPNPQGINPKLVSSWIGGGGTVEPVTGDKDVFGDGTVMMLATPGHTPGHHSLLVKLAQMGNVILSGDFVHFRENLETSGVPSFNFDRAQSLASIDRMKRLAANIKATIVIQHDLRDVATLPAFPAAAR
jgi:glyoxylase-like metal-dependent hydrolase (beta-lactamase superfamily II)